MAFQAGSQIDPRLAALDFSGFTNAAAIQAQGMENLGEGVSKGITGYKKKKKQERIDQSKVNAATSLGDSFIKLIGEKDEEGNINPKADAIADMMAANFGEDIPLSQRAAMADKFASNITTMLLLNERQQAPSIQMLPNGVGVVNVQGDSTVIDPSRMNPYGGYGATMGFVGGSPYPKNEIPSGLSPEQELEMLELERQASQ
tara:strand:- start:428 stop:1033 length:606 start_codon:yes stop_codon:yes gene_type:complete